MISRLTELRVRGFRAFRQSATIPLDADVVLLYGANATGKTSVLSAIEYAITGRVAELSVFETDYPRCLVNGATGEVELDARLADGGTISSVQSLPAQADAVHLDDWVAVQRFFRDRCYLSQRQLGRLLELYQEPRGPGRDQPLSEFVQELLQLDLVRHLQDGLRIAMDFRRVRNKSDSLQELEQQQSAMQKAEEVSNRSAKAAKLAVDDAADELLIALKAVDLPGPPERTGLEFEITSAVATLKSELGLADERLDRMRQAASELDVLREIEQQDSPRPDDEALLTELASLERRLAGVDASLGDMSVALGELLGVPADHAGAGELETLIAKAHERAQGLLESIKAFDDAVARRTHLESEASGLRHQIAAATVPASSVADRRLIEILAEIRRFITDEHCPVCNRDYREVAGGTLHDHLGSRLSILGEGISRLDTAAKLRAQLQESLTTIEERLSALREHLSQDEKRIQASRQTAALLRTLLARAEESNQARAERATIEAALRVRRLQLQELQMRNIRDKKLRTRLVAMASAVGLTLLADRSAHELIAVLRSELDTLVSAQKARVDGARSRLVLLERCGSQLGCVAQLRRELSSAERDVADVVKATGDLEAKRQRVESAIRHAKSVVRAAGEVQKLQLDRIINAQLNRTWQEVFLRLVPGEVFYPQVDDVILQRGHRAEVKFQVKTERGVGVFEQPGSILSAGNLNTAALSLFLALYLVERSPLPVLVLDDPVQSMDDIRVGELTMLLRRVVRQRELQVIIAIHERALFEYLRLELGPNCPSDALLAIALERDDATDGPRVTYQRVTWEKGRDSVRFGDDRSTG